MKTHHLQRQSSDGGEWTWQMNKDQARTASRLATVWRHNMKGIRKPTTKYATASTSMVTLKCNVCFQSWNQLPRLRKSQKIPGIANENQLAKSELCVSSVLCSHYQHTVDLLTARPRISLNTGILSETTQETSHKTPHIDAHRDLAEADFACIAPVPLHSRT